ncbi:MAG: hypothetical protein LQ352_001308 [Teloschistes flavicans]|nr:MAG: hypothetical protein LQ352_001308 [Teloschistes flavicans]
MEIDNELPRPTGSNTHPHPMETSLSFDLSPAPAQPAATPADHALPPKPSTAQEILKDVEKPTLQDIAAQPSGQMVHNSPRTPHLQQDLLTLFGLQPLAATVARTDPKTGEKINKMRKSYEGQVKRLGLAGRNRAVKHNNEKSMGLLQITRLPAEEWHIQRVHGRDIRDGLPEATLQKLGSAMQMESGPAKKSDEHDWDDLLGIEKVKPLPNIEDRSKKHMRPENGSKVNGQTNGVRTAPSKGPVTEANRPKRAGKKRRYDDSSFEGYDEGYLDDEGDVLGDLGGNSSEDGSRKGGAAKKRKKDHVSPNAPTLGDRRGSYGIGMLGVGSGIGAYGR